MWQAGVVQIMRDANYPHAGLFRGLQLRQRYYIGKNYVIDLSKYAIC